jgi:UDP-N-acetylglucosamine 2-epimerase (non-hydrolysing)
MAIIDLIAGARPNFMKIAPLVRALDRRRVEGASNRPLTYRLIHTGQHYDAALSGSFFDALGLPAPHVNLEAGSGTQAEQAAAIMVRYERLLLSAPSDLCVVVGDVTSTMACAIVAQKCGVRVAHVEGGLRSGDWRMPEEINRLVTDAITNFFFTTSESAGDHLRRAGVTSDRIFFVGNTMVDTLLAQLPRLQPPSFWDDLALTPGGYLVLTLHRPSNVDDPNGLRMWLDAIAAAARGLPVIFPAHPRTRKSLETISDVPAAICVVPPQSYLEFNYLVKHARAVITDSGGVTEETTMLGIPCVTVRDTTERPETVTMGTNELVGTEPAALGGAMARIFEGRWKSGRIPDLWDGQAGERIVAVLETLC